MCMCFVLMCSSLVDNFCVTFMPRSEAGCYLSLLDSTHSLFFLIFCSSPSKSQPHPFLLYFFFLPKITYAQIFLVIALLLPKFFKFFKFVRRHFFGFCFSHKCSQSQEFSSFVQHKTPKSTENHHTNHLQTSLRFIGIQSLQSLNFQPIYSSAPKLTAEHDG